MTKHRDEWKTFAAVALPVLEDLVTDTDDEQYTGDGKPSGGVALSRDEGQWAVLKWPLQLKYC